MEFGDGLGIMILEVPAAVSKKPVSGKDGAKLLELCDSQDVVAVFTTAKEAASGGGEATGFAEGDVVEAKYGSSWASAVVLEAAEPGAKVKLKWDYDRTEAELESWDVQKKESAQEAQEVVEFSAGDKVEAKYGSSFYDAEVLSMSMEDGKVKLKWGHDGSEAELDAADVKLKPDSQEKEAAPPAELKEGDKVEAKYGDSFHDAEVVTPETEDGKVKVKWGFDGSEAEVDPSEVKVKPEEPPEPPEKLLVIGFLRPRLEVELRTMNRIEAKAPGHCLTNPRASDEGPGVGIGIMELTPSDGSMAKLIGKGGAMKMKIASISGCSFEYMAKDSETKQAWILGTAEERARTTAILELLQHSVDFRTRAQELPAALQDWSSSFTVSGNAGRGLNASFGMQTIEDSTETFIFTLSKPSGPASVVKRDIVKDPAQECKSKGEWLEATVLEVSTWSAESDDEDETDGRTLKVRFNRDGTESTVLASWHYSRA
ncbi:ECA4 [Symbiodinium sp. KB8]|nr:ECA4 [Symbiodinium sp. KB8]